MRIYEDSFCYLEDDLRKFINLYMVGVEIDLNRCGCDIKRASFKIKVFKKKRN